MGLGLAIASQAAHLLGGQLRVESKLGDGSKFSLVLPLTPPRP
jgi:signal transduction histidine kinase